MSGTTVQMIKLEAFLRPPVVPFVPWFGRDFPLESTTEQSALFIFRGHVLVSKQPEVRSCFGHLGDVDGRFAMGSKAEASPGRSHEISDMILKGWNRLTSGCPP